MTDMILIYNYQNTMIAFTPGVTFALCFDMDYLILNLRDGRALIVLMVHGVRHGIKCCTPIQSVGFFV